MMPYTKCQALGPVVSDKKIFHIFHIAFDPEAGQGHNLINLVEVH